MRNLFLALTLALAATACSIEKGGFSTGVSPSPTTGGLGGSPSTTFDLTRGAVQLVGRTSTGEGYVRWYGNLNSLETQIADWNGATFDLYVVNGTIVLKFVVQYGNDVVTVNGQNWPATIIRRLNFGPAVNFYLKVEPIDPVTRARQAPMMVTYEQWSNAQLFQLVPSNLMINLASFYTTGPLPSMDSATLSAGSFGEQSQAPMPSNGIESAPDPTVSDGS